PSKSPEAIRCKQIKSILNEYVIRAKVSSPLSIAVFGPPGSGKSFYVTEIISSLKGNVAEPVLVNLSQLSSPKDLAGAFKKAGEDKAEKTTKVFFFDEFDASLNESPLGWLRWFLAPMQDGKFFFEGQSISISKAIFIFAGGTAASFEEFQQKAQIDPADYRNKKVPDFISRLRGFIDIQGINNLDKERAVRRALVLRYQLEKRWPDRRTATSNREFPIHRDLVESLLSNAHFVHGVRSMEALLDMSRLKRRRVLTKKQLPDNDLKILHISRGLLDERMIGISAGQKEDKASAFLGKLTDDLLQNGASLAYGGDFIHKGTLHSIVHAAKKVP